MVLGLTFVTLGLGLLLLLGVLAVAYVDEHQPAERVGCLGGGFLGYVLSAGILLLIFRSWYFYVSPLIEESVKLGMIVALGARGRMCVLVALAFAACELIDKSLLPVMASMEDAQGSWLWIVLVLAPVVLHAATGVIYSARAVVRTEILFGAAVVLHYSYNFTIGWLAAESETWAIATASALAMAGIALILSFAVKAWAQGRAEPG